MARDLDFEAVDDADHRPATDELIRLYRRAFQEFGAIALWSSSAAENPTIADAMAIVGSLRVEGNLAARRLAEQIEAARRALN